MDIHYLPNISDSQLLAPVPSHALHPAFPYVVLTIGLVAILYWCIQDYRFFLSLGRGGRMLFPLANRHMLTCSPSPVQYSRMV